MELRLPLRHIYVTQPFGVNYVDFYKKMGLSGHPGVDFRAYNGFKCYASHDGVITRAGKFSDGGLGVEILKKSGNFATFYYHFKEVHVKIGQKVIAGQEIGLCDNTGKYTTADHLHFELRITDNKGNIIEKIDPAPYFQETYNGIKIGNKDWDKSNAYHRYYRGRPKGGYWIERFRVVPALIKYLKRLPSNEEINACTYGGWDREAVENPAMYFLWAYITKYNYENGKRPFQN